MLTRSLYIKTTFNIFLYIETMFTRSLYIETMFTWSLYIKTTRSLYTETMFTRSLYIETMFTWSLYIDHIQQIPLYRSCSPDSFIFCICNTKRVVEVIFKENSSLSQELEFWASSRLCRSQVACYKFTQTNSASWYRGRQGNSGHSCILANNF